MTVSSSLQFVIWHPEWYKLKTGHYHGLTQSFLHKAYKCGVPAPPSVDRNDCTMTAQQSAISTGYINNTRWHWCSKLEYIMTFKIWLQCYFLLILFQNILKLLFLLTMTSLSYPILLRNSCSLSYLILHSSVANKHVHGCQITLTTQKHISSRGKCLKLAKEIMET